MSSQAVYIEKGGGLAYVQIGNVPKWLYMPKVQTALYRFANVLSLAPNLNILYPPTTHIHISNLG